MSELTSTGKMRPTETVPLGRPNEPLGDIWYIEALDFDGKARPVYPDGYNVALTEEKALDVAQQEANKKNVLLVNVFKRTHMVSVVTQTKKAKGVYS